MAASMPPPFRGLPGSARLYLLALYVLALIAFVVVRAAAPGPAFDPFLFALLVVLCAGGNLFEVFAPGHYSFQINLVFFFWGSVLLPPWALVVLAVVSFAPGWIVHRFRWYMTGFNIVNYALSGLTAHWIAGATGTAAGGIDGGLQLAGALASALAFVAVNHGLLMLVITFAQGRPLREGLVDKFEGVPLDSALALTGACLVALWQATPALAALVVGPMFLMYRALWLPIAQHKARTDPKTGLYNYDHLMKSLADELNLAKRRGEKLAVVMIDLDDLRMINNRYGHLVGDTMIKGVGGLLSETAGTTGLAARFGGEEFCLLLPGMSAAAARITAEKLRARIDAMRFAHDPHGELRVTISAGVAAYPDHGKNATELLSAADAAVYEAKLGGRNRVRLPLTPGAQAALERSVSKPTPSRLVARDIERRPLESIDRQTRKTGEESSAPPAASAREPVSPSRRLIPWYAALLCLGAVCVGLFSSPSAIRSDPILFALLVVSALAMDVVRIDLFERANISPASIASIALAIGFGPLGPLASEAVIAASRAIRREWIVKWTWDFGALSLAGAAAAFAYDALPGGGPALLVVGGAVAGLAYYAVNMSLLSVVMGLNDGRGPVVQWREGLAWLAPHFAAFGVMAGTFLLAEQRLGGYVLAVFGVPIAMLWIAQKQYTDKTRSSVDELRRNEEQLRALLAEKVDLIARMHHSYLSTITSLARSIEARDPYTGGHTERVSTIAYALGAHLGFGEDELRAVEVGAIVHDIGKIGIPDEILLKPGSLSEEEFSRMQRHPDIASYILAELDLPSIVKQMTRSHHERYDGGGYPDGLVGEEIPIAARVLTVADALDAMTSDRPYRRAMPLEVARREIEDKAGTQFCPRVVAAFQECLENDRSFRELFASADVAA
jgi:diguanylate cyclase (GGDEF)-like protein